MMNLYEINSSLQGRLTAFGELIENGATPSFDEVKELLDLKQDLADKLVNYGKFIKNQENDIEGIDAEIKRLTALKRTKQNKVSSMKNTMLIVMSENGLTKIDDPVMPISLRKNPPSVRIDIDIDRLPSEYVKVEYKADKTALAHALKNGATVAGASLETKQGIKIG